MTNWLADPVACAIRLKDEAGCIILAGRNQVLSRSTRVYRRVYNEGQRNEETVWAAGNIEVMRTGKDHRHTMDGKGNLTLTRWLNESQGASMNQMLSTEAIMMADVLRAAAVNVGGSACGGQTLLELMWAELMTVVDRLMSDQPAADGRDPGRAEGIAYAIAIMQNPYRPSWEGVRDEAVNRWEAEDAQ